MLLQQSKLSKRREVRRVAAPLVRHTFSCFRGGLMVWLVLAGMAITVGNLEAQEVGNPNRALGLPTPYVRSAISSIKWPGNHPIATHQLSSTSPIYLE
jgi:hypothetical protein